MTMQYNSNSNNDNFCHNILHNVVAEVEDVGLDFILSHFEEPIWPRMISTKTTEGRQILVYSKEEALARFRQSNFIDCRINAYPDYTGFEGINRQAPNFIFIDIDKSTFKTERAFQLALSKTLKNFRDSLGANSPSVVFSGNGYHIYQPLQASFPLEQEEIFIHYSLEPSKEFLRFAELYLSNYKSDPLHRPSFKSCMIRIPGSLNSKCDEKEVKIIQKWDHYKPAINWLLRDFRRYLINQKIKKQIAERELQKRFSKYRYDNSNNSDTIIHWIESLLQTPLSDHRKYCIWRILAPYLMNVRNLSYEESFATIMNWLEKCKLQKRRLDFNAKAKIKEGLNSAQKKGYFPISLNNLKTENKELYDDMITISIANKN